MQSDHPTTGNTIRPWASLAESQSPARLGSKLDLSLAGPLTSRSSSGVLEAKAEP